MALMSTRIQIISKKTRSAVGAAAYRACAKLTGHDGTLYDYTRKGHIERAEIMAPEGSPDWVHDRQTLWQKVDAKEKRFDAQVAREFRVMLPREFSPEQRIEVAREFVQKHFVSRGMIADVAWHNPPASDGQANVHFHVMLPLRPIVNGEFGNKTVGARMKKKREDGAPKFQATTDWNDHARWKEARDDWAVLVNRALADNGSSSRVDPRSFQERGIQQLPQPYLGVAARIVEGEMTLSGKVREYSARMRSRVNQWMAQRASSRAWGFAQKALDARMERVEKGANQVAGVFERFVEWIDDANTRLRDAKLYGLGHMQSSPKPPDDPTPNKGIDR